MGRVGLPDRETLPERPAEVAFGEASYAPRARHDASLRVAFNEQGRSSDALSRAWEFLVDCNI